MPKPQTLPELLTSLQRGETLVLPGLPAVRSIRSIFDAAQRSAGLSVWQPAPAHAWAQWTSGLHADLIVHGAESRLLLNSAQQHALWQQVIADDPPPQALGAHHTLAQLAASAFQRAAAWNALPRLRASVTHSDTAIFARWAEEFLRRCTTQRLLPPALLESTLAGHLRAGTLTPPPPFNLLGFPSFTPAQQTLLQALATHGTPATELRITNAAPAAHALLRAADPQDELACAARWLRQTLEKGARAALIVPGLSAERDALESALRNVLAPELNNIHLDLSVTPWELSCGVPLRSLTLVRHAFSICQWTLNPLTQIQITDLLLSPYLSADREADARIDALLRRKEPLLRPELTLHQLLQRLHRQHATVPWPQHLATQLDRSGDLRQPRLHSEWMELLRSLLQAAGWPGTRALDAAETEAARAWDSLLDRLATLDFAGQRVTLPQALRALERELDATAFHPPSTAAQLQVIDAVDAHGALFDAVLYLRATEDNLPAPEATHPLLSWQLQRSLAMPGTDPARTTAAARHHLQNLLAATPTVLFTCATEDAEAHQRPSPLLESLNLASLDPSALRPSPTAPPLVCDTLSDTTPLPPLADPHIRGGSSVLKAQAACGFQAFARFRLNTADLETQDLGLDAADTGNRLHRALQIFWRTVQSQQELVRLHQDDPAQLQTLLQESVRGAFASELRTTDPWELAYIDIQQRRLNRVLGSWLETEIQRAPFTTISIERDQLITIGPLTLDVRFDRIDRLTDSDTPQFVLVDYKSGTSGKPADWDGPRPGDPQLPLYAVQYQPEEIAALAFARVLTGKSMGWSGIQAAPGILPLSPSRTPNDLPTRLEQWRHVVTQLAEDFAAGRALVDPKDYPATCTLCTQRLLCRLNPEALNDLSEDDSDAPEAADD